MFLIFFIHNQCFEQEYEKYKNIDIFLVFTEKMYVYCMGLFFFVIIIFDTPDITHFNIYHLF